MAETLSGYQLSRIWFDWCFENPEKISPNHSALYFFCIEHCNRLGWKDKFGLPTTMAKEAIGIKNYRTYINTLNDLVDFGFIKMVERSKNQYSANIVALVQNTKALAKALDKAMIKHGTKQGKSIDSIDKPLTLNLEPETIIEAKAFSPSEIIINILNEVLKKEKGFRVLDEGKAKSILKIYSEDEIRQAVENATKDEYHISKNFQYLTPEFFTRKDKVEKFLNFKPYVKRNSIDSLKDNARKAIDSQFKDLSDTFQERGTDNTTIDLPVY